MLTRYLLPALALLSLALGGAAWFYQQRADAATNALQRATARLQQVEAAAEVHRAHIARMQAEAARWTDLETDLQSMEGRDEPLSDHLGAAARRLWAE